MQFKSNAQKRLFLNKLAKGEISQAEYAEMEKATKGTLPEKVKPKRTKGTLIKKIKVK